MAKEFADIHALVGQVAKDYQYKTVHMPDWISSLWDQMWQLFHRLIDWIWAQLGKLFSGLNIPLIGKDSPSKLTIMIFLGLLLCVAIALVVWQQRRWLKSRWAGEKTSESHDIAGQCRTSLAWQQQATEFKEKGQYLEACRSLHRACLQLFDEAQLITFAAARSNYEYMLALRRLPAANDVQSRQNLRKTFQTFSNTVDAVYFGNRAAGEAEFEFCLKCLQETESFLANISTNTQKSSPT